MAASLSSPADIVNAALAELKYPLRVGDLYDGTPAAKKALDIYGQARDALLRSDDWGFPRGDIVLALLKQAPPGGYVPGVSDWNSANNPPMPYLYEYAYPSDCLMLRAIQPPAIFIPNFILRPYVFEIGNDNVPVTGQQSAPGRVIFCYCASAVGTYVRQVTDMTQWDVGFVDAFVAEVKRRIGPAIAEMSQGMAEAEKLDVAVEQATLQRAVGRQG